MSLPRNHPSVVKRKPLKRAKKKSVTPDRWPIGADDPNEIRVVNNNGCFYGLDFINRYFDLDRLVARVPVGPNRIPEVEAFVYRVLSNIHSEFYLLDPADEVEWGLDTSSIGGDDECCCDMRPALQLLHGILLKHYNSENDFPYIEDDLCERVVKFLVKSSDTITVTVERRRADASNCIKVAVSIISPDDEANPHWYECYFKCEENFIEEDEAHSLERLMELSERAMAEIDEIKTRFIERAQDEIGGIMSDFGHDISQELDEVDDVRANISLLLHSCVRRRVRG